MDLISEYFKWHSALKTTPNDKKPTLFIKMSVGKTKQCQLWFLVRDTKFCRVLVSILQTTTKSLRRRGFALLFIHYQYKLWLHLLLISTSVHLPLWLLLPNVDVKWKEAFTWKKLTPEVCLWWFYVAFASLFVSRLIFVVLTNCTNSPLCMTTRHFTKATTVFGSWPYSMNDTDCPKWLVKQSICWSTTSQTISNDQFIKKEKNTVVSALQIYNLLLFYVQLNIDLIDQTKHVKMSLWSVFNYVWYFIG